jgi:beta-glucosidase
LTDILRAEWKFPGFVVSDYNSVSELIPHGVAADNVEAARLGLTAGVDMEMVSTTYRDTLKQQVAQGTMAKKVLDEAVRRILTVKFTKGLFDRPYTDATLYKTAYLQDDATDLAREAAAKSCVLLKNENHVLPLSPHANKIVLLGPFAENAQELVGPWHSLARTNDLITLAEAMRKQLNFDFQLAVARGCPMLEPGNAKVPLNITDFSPLKEKPEGTNEIAEAVELAKTADVVVLALGEPLDWSGESASRTDLGLPGRQQQLFDAVVAAGKPVVVVLFNGRPLALPRIQERAGAILEAWFPGGQGAAGVADVLFGGTDPAGRLTTTFPRNVGQVPFYYNHYNTGRPGFGEYKGNYVDVPTTPLYPFGFGLAYTTFEYGKVELNTLRAKINGAVSGHVTIKNTGARAGTEVAQLYLRALYASAGPRPVRELKGFQKILLQPGESRDVNFTLPAKEFGYYDAFGRWLVEPGNYQLWIAKDSASGEPAAFQLVK